MSKFGECEGYIDAECEYCGRVRVEHYSNGCDICEKCHWCKQLQSFVTSEELYDEEEYGSWFTEGEECKND